MTELGERVVIIRHDVDNIYGIYRPLRFGNIFKAVNYGFLALLSVTPKLRYFVPFYEEHIPFLLDIEKKYGARATYFFRTVTIPRIRLLNSLKGFQHEIGYHSDRNYSYEVWFKDLKYIEKEVDVRIRGFTRHGYSIIRGGGGVPYEKLVDYASRAGLEYVAKGEGPGKCGLPYVDKGVWMFKHGITLKFTPLKYLRAYLEKCLPLVLIHPEDIFIPGEIEKIEYMLTKNKGVSVIEVIRVLDKIAKEYEWFNS